MLAQEIKHLPEGNYIFALTKSYPSKSPKQMAYYRGVVLPFAAKELGYDNLDELHQDFKTYFKIGTLSELNVVEFQQFLVKLLRWLVQFHGIVVPEPKEKYETKN